MTIRGALRCLILNAGGTSFADKAGAVAWAHETAGGELRPHIAFVQEVPSDAWLEAWRAAGYRHIFGHRRGWKVRSVILTVLPEAECLDLNDVVVPELRYHGEYVAGASLIGWGPAGTDLTLLSVHASPHPTLDEYLADYPAPDTIRRRDGGKDPRHRGQLFDADVVLETIARYGPRVVACGDLNEARGWDHVPAHRGQTWGAEYFGKPDAYGVLSGGSVQIRNLIDVPLSASHKEVETRCAPGHPSLQLDHIVTSRQIADQIANVQVPKWSSHLGWSPGLADHAPITFDLRPSAEVRTCRASAGTAH